MGRPIRLLAIDIDGTLLDSRFELSPANREAVVSARQLGIEIVLVTGRRFSFAQPIVAQFGVELAVLASNGAVVKSADGVTLARQLLPRRLARAVLAATRSWRESAVLVFDRDAVGQLVAEPLRLSHPSVLRYFERSSHLIRYVEQLEAALDDDPIQVLFMGQVQPMRDLFQELRQDPGESVVSLARTEYPLRDLTILDVLARGCNKGAALARWAAERGIAPQETMAIGDNWNDWEMLQFAGLAVVMGNGTPELKDQGWPVTASNDENGVAQAIQKYLLRV